MSPNPHRYLEYNDLTALLADVFQLLRVLVLHLDVCCARGYVDPMKLRWLQYFSELAVLYLPYGVMSYFLQICNLV